MGRIRDVQPTVLVAGIMFTDSGQLQQGLDELVDRYGPVAFTGPVFDFDMTDYYTPEMGPAIRKQFLCFERLLHPGRLADIKRVTNDIEQRLATGEGEEVHRRVNIDPGYVTLSKLVLASTKDYSHRIYIGGNIYAETTLRYLKGTFYAIDTTYPDYAAPTAIDFFNRVRDYLKENLP